MQVPLAQLYHQATNASISIRPFQESEKRAVIANIEAICAERIYLQTECFQESEEWIAVFQNPVDTAHCRLLLVASCAGRPIGHARLFPDSPSDNSNRTANFGFSIIKGYRDMGIGSCMVKLAQHWAIGSEIHRITAQVLLNNQRSIRVLKKCGFVREKDARVGHQADNSVSQITLIWQSTL